MWGSGDAAALGLRGFYMGLQQVYTDFTWVLRGFYMGFTWVLHGFTRGLH